MYQLGQQAITIVPFTVMTRSKAINPRLTATLCSTSSVDSTGRDFGITPLMKEETGIRQETTNHPENGSFTPVTSSYTAVILAFIHVRPIKIIPLILSLANLVVGLKGEDP